MCVVRFICYVQKTQKAQNALSSSHWLPCPNQSTLRNGWLLGSKLATQRTTLKVLERVQESALFCAPRPIEAQVVIPPPKRFWEKNDEAQVSMTLTNTDINPGPLLSTGPSHMRDTGDMPSGDAPCDGQSQLIAQALLKGLAPAVTASAQESSAFWKPHDFLGVDRTPSWSVKNICSLLQGLNHLVYVEIRSHKKKRH